MSGEERVSRPPSAQRGGAPGLISVPRLLRPSTSRVTHSSPRRPPRLPSESGEGNINIGLVDALPPPLPSPEAAAPSVIIHPSIVTKKSPKRPENPEPAPKKRQKVTQHILHRPGIEPGSVPWQGTILPLDHRCIFLQTRYSYPVSVNHQKSETDPCATFFRDCVLVVPRRTQRSPSDGREEHATWAESRVYDWCSSPTFCSFPRMGFQCRIFVWFLRRLDGHWGYIRRRLVDWVDRERNRGIHRSS